MNSIKNILLLGVITVCGLGCGSNGPQLGTVTGVLTQEGSPVTGALVEFFPEEGKTSTGTTDAEGKYVLSYEDSEGAIIGEHTVQVTVGVPQPAVDPESMEVAPPMMEPPKTVVLPQKVSVKEGENSIELQLPKG